MPEDGLVLITGASGGMGVALADFLLGAGRRDLVFQYRSRAEPIAEVLRKYGLSPEERAFRADLTDDVSAGQLRKEIESRVGPVRGLVNLAGGSSNGMSWKLSTQEFRRVLDQNLLTTFLACREFAPGMRDRQSGRIINVSSVTAYTGAVGASHYCAAKAGVVGFSKTLALELARKNVVVSVIALGYFRYGLINTIADELKEQIQTRIPAGHFGGCEEFGGLVQYLLSDAGGYAGGQVYHLNGGLYS